MRHILLPLFIALLFLPLSASAQWDWQFDGAFPPDSLSNSAHGIAVDDEGKVWIAPYYSSLFPFGPENADTVRRNPLYVHDAEGNPAAFSPILEWVDAEDDTFRMGPVTGMNTDHEGNILVAIHGTRNDYDGGTWHSTTAWILRVDAATGELLNKFDVTFIRDDPAVHAPNRPAVTEDGYIFVSFVFPSMIIIIDPTQPEDYILGEVTDSKPGFSRTLEVSPDGQWVYHTNISTNSFVLYYSEFGVLGEYEMYPDTTFGLGMHPGAISIDPLQPNLLWAAAAGGSGAPELDEDLWDKNKIYALDRTTWERVDSVEYVVDPGVFSLIRSLAFSPDGEYMYAGTFGTAAPSVLRFSRDPVSVRPDDRTIVEGFNLSQNYPNPFNPATEIQFTIGESGLTTLTVYDILGRKITTLVNEHLQEGGYTATFDATHLPSGTYMYVLESSGQRLMKRMLLVK